MTLDNANIGSTVKIIKLTGQEATKKRIMDMGITKGAEIYIRKVAPLGDPNIHIFFKNQKGKSILALLVLYFERYIFLLV